MSEDDSGDESEQDVPGTVFSDATREILSKVREFSNLERLVVEFDWDENQLERAFYHFEKTEDHGQIEMIEREDAWRALMAKTYAAIGTNQGVSKIKSLEMKDVLAKVPSSWGSGGFKAFLGSIEEFKISIRGMDNGAGWCLNTCDGYWIFMSKIGPNLTDHLKTVERLSIAANSDGPIGCEGHNHIASSLMVDSMPKLKHLHLRYFFLDPPLLRFIEAHLDVLESIKLENSYAAGVHGLAENGYPWTKFFNQIAAKNPMKLKTLTIIPEAVQLPWDVPELWNEDKEKANSAKALLESGSRAFSYGHLVRISIRLESFEVS